MISQADYGGCLWSVVVYFTVVYQHDLTGRLWWLLVFGRGIFYCSILTWSDSHRQIMVVVGGRSW